MKNDAPFPTRLVIGSAIVGVVVLGVAAYVVSAYEFLTTPYFDALYPGSTQNLRGWLAYPTSISWALVVGGIPGALIGSVVGVVVGGFRARSAA